MKVNLLLSLSSELIEQTVPQRVELFEIRSFILVMVRRVIVFF